MNLLLKLDKVHNFKKCLGGILFHYDESTNIGILDEEKYQPLSIEIGAKVKDYYCIGGNRVIVVDDANNGYSVANSLLPKNENITFDSLSGSLGLAISTKWVSYFPVDVEHLIFDIDSLDVLWKGRSNSLRFESDLLISELNGGFNLYNPRNGSVLWTYLIPDTRYSWFNLGSVYISERSIPIKAEIKTILGVYDGLIYLTLNSGVVLGLDADSGEEKVSIMRPSIYPVQWSNEDAYIHNVDLITELDKENGVLFGISNKYYGEIDLKTEDKVYSVIDLSKEMSHIDRLGVGCWDDDEIFLYERSFGQDPAHVAVFDRAKRSITWTSKEMGDGGIFKGINKLECSRNILYVLDRVNTLHIFERLVE